MSTHHRPPGATGRREFLGLSLTSVLLQAADTRDPRAEALARAMMDAMGGEARWNAVRYIRYDFKVSAAGKAMASRSHLWDKHGGRYRVEQTGKDGLTTVALFSDMGKQTATCYQGAAKLEGSAQAKAAKDAYGAYINDMYWLAMPWKWLDGGVNLKYLGPRPRGAEKFEVVELSFGKVGLTPGDRYRAFVSPQSKLMTYWEYTLQSGRKGAFNWEYTNTGGIKLASNHRSADGTVINMGDVRVLDRVDEAYFTDPARSLSGLR